MMKTVNVGVLVSACVSLARSAGSIIRSVSESGELHTVQKGIDDPMTDADLASQKLIVSGLLRHWPSLRIVGEEDIPSVQPMEDGDARLPRLDLLDERSVPGELRSVLVDDLAVFVDPLDATKEYTLGKTWCVMTLIGVTLKGIPIAGVMHQPFAGDEGHTVYALQGYGVIGLKRKPHDSSDGVVAVTSLSHFSRDLEEAIKLVRPDKVIQEGGCGYKALMVAQGQADVYLYPQPGTKRWDSCAPDAILRELGGTMTDRDGKEIVYRNTGDMLNLSLVASIDKNLHRRVIESLKVKNKI